MFIVDDESRKSFLHFRNGDKGFQGPEVQVVVKRIHAQGRVGIAQIRERVASLIAIATFGCIAVEIEDRYRLRAAGLGEILCDEVVANLKQRIFLFQSYYLGIITAELVLGIRESGAEVGELAREGG